MRKPLLDLQPFTPLPTWFFVFFIFIARRSSASTEPREFEIDFLPDSQHRSPFFSLAHPTVNLEYRRVCDTGREQRYTFRYSRYANGARKSRGRAAIEIDG